MQEEFESVKKLELVAAGVVYLSVSAAGRVGGSVQIRAKRIVNAL